MFSVREKPSETPRRRPEKRITLRWNLWTQGLRMTNVMYVPFYVFCILFVCKCVLYYCHRVSTRIAVKKKERKKEIIIIIIINWIQCVSNAALACYRYVGQISPCLQKVQNIRKCNKVCKFQLSSFVVLFVILHQILIHCRLQCT
jgi:hypothetical protein